MVWFLCFLFQPQCKLWKSQSKKSMLFLFFFCFSCISVRFTVVALVVSYLLAGYACRLSAAGCIVVRSSVRSVYMPAPALGRFLLTLRKMLFTPSTECGRRITEACCRVIAMINVLSHIHCTHPHSYTYIQKRTHIHTKYKQ